MSEIYEEYLKLLYELKEYDANKIPLCAAETYCSPFVKSALTSEFEGKYCMRHLDYDMASDFVGSGYVNRLYELLTRQCAKMFRCKYADARTLSGLNCITLVINAILPRGGKVLLTTPNQGGHPSIPLILNLAGISFDDIPYDYENKDFDYLQLNSVIKKNDYDAIVIAQSDLLTPADTSKIETRGIPVIYDATQTFGMIASQIHNNPLDIGENVILIGGTHKTLPGPTSGLILSNNETLFKKLDGFISPSCLRNTQPNNIAGVLLALLETECFGREYLTRTIKNANTLGKLLQQSGFEVMRLSQDKYTCTHQLFLSMSYEEKNVLIGNAHKYGVTMNGKEKRLFGGSGIRLGLQEVSRYGWAKEEMHELVLLLKELAKEFPADDTVYAVKRNLGQQKNEYFVFDY